MSDEDIREKFPIKTIPKIIGDPNYKAINKMRGGLYANTAAIPTALRGVQNGHNGLLMDTSVYESVSTTGYTRPTETGPYAQHGTSDTAAARANANSIHKEDMRFYNLYDNLNTTSKQEIIDAV